jgi:hypothetical protein
MGPRPGLPLISPLDAGEETDRKEEKRVLTAEEKGSCEAAEKNLDVPSELIGRVPTFLYCYFKR